MKSKNTAFFLNFLLPGAGFAYLGRWKLAGLNLIGALAVGAVLVLIMPESFWDGLGRYLAFGIGGASGAWAMQVTEEMNEAKAAEANRIETLDELSDQARLS